MSIISYFLFLWIWSLLMTKLVSHFAELSVFCNKSIYVSFTCWYHTLQINWIVIKCTHIACFVEYSCPVICVNFTALHRDLLTCLLSNWNKGEPNEMNGICQVISTSIAWYQTQILLYGHLDLLPIFLLQGLQYVYVYISDIWYCVLDVNIVYDWIYLLALNKNGS